jgi:hypothetical protein
MTTPEGDAALAQLLSQDPYLGMYAPDGADAPSGYTEVRDAGGHRVFLNDQVLRDLMKEEGTIRVGKLMGTPGTPAPDPRFPTVDLPTTNDVASWIEETGIPTVNRSAQAQAARARAQQPGTDEPEKANPTGQDMVDALTRLFTQDPAEALRLTEAEPDALATFLGATAAGAKRTITLDADWFARITGHFAAVQTEMEGLAQYATELREDLNAIKQALALVTEGDPLPPTDFHTHPWAMDMMASLKRAREDAEQARATAGPDPKETA